jgi:hypothetical protein
MATHVKTDAWAASMATGRILEGAAMGINNAILTDEFYGFTIRTSRGDVWLKNSRAVVPKNTPASPLRLTCQPVTNFCRILSVCVALLHGNRWREWGRNLVEEDGCWPLALGRWLWPVPVTSWLATLWHARRGGSKNEWLQLYNLT